MSNEDKGKNDFWDPLQAPYMTEQTKQSGCCHPHSPYVITPVEMVDPNANNLENLKVTKNLISEDLMGDGLPVPAEYKTSSNRKRLGNT